MKIMLQDENFANKVYVVQTEQQHNFIMREIEGCRTIFILAFA